MLRKGNFSNIKFDDSWQINIKRIIEPAEPENP